MAALVAWRGGTFGAVLASLLALMTTMFLLSSSFYTHYPGFLAPVAALVVAGGTTLLFESLGGRAPRPVTVAAAGLVLVLLVGVGGARAARHATNGPVQPDYGARIAALVPGDACLTADDPTWILVGRAIPAAGVPHSARSPTSSANASCGRPPAARSASRRRARCS